jgi:hypothetical protein
MNAPLRVQDCTTTPSRDNTSLLRRLLSALVSIFSSPRGDQAGWEGGARGL